MSQNQFVFLKTEAIPSKQEIQASIDAAEYDLKIDPEFSLLEDEGFSPCILGSDDDVGFEIYSQPVEEMLTESEDSELARIVGDNDYCISLCWSDSFKDCACVMIVSLVLMKHFDAKVSYEGEGVESLETLVSGINECFQEIEKGND